MGTLVSRRKILNSGEKLKAYQKAAGLLIRFI